MEGKDMILFNCSCGLRHSFFHPCNGTIDINSASDDNTNVLDAIVEGYAKDVKEEQDHGWTDPIRRTRIEP